MNGFQIFLCVIAGIIGFFVLILSIPVHVSVGYDDKIRLSIKYLFIKLNILPVGEKKPKKDKPAKEKQPKPEEPKKEPEEKKEKKPNPILEMVKANGHDGMLLVIQNLGKVMGTYGGKLFKSVVFDEIVLHICVGTGDSATTAIKYGKTCRKVYPIFGFICSNNLVRRYDIDVHPDFLANKTESEFYMDFHICIRRIINASIGMLFRLIFKVVLTFLKGAKKNKPAGQSNSDNTKSVTQTEMKG